MATRFLRTAVPQQVRQSQRGHSRHAVPTHHQRHQSHYQSHYQPSPHHHHHHQHHHYRQPHSPYTHGYRYDYMQPPLPATAKRIFNGDRIDNDDEDDDSNKNNDNENNNESIDAAGTIATGLLERSSPTWYPKSEYRHSLGRALWSRGTWDDPMPIASNTDERVVACTGISPGAASGAPSAPHPTTWITVTTFHPRQCPDCGQVFKLERRNCNLSPPDLPRQFIDTHDNA